MEYSRTLLCLVTVEKTFKYIILILILKMKPRVLRVNIAVSLKLIMTIQYEFVALLLRAMVINTR